MPSLEQATQPIDKTGLTPVVSAPGAAAIYTQQQYPPNPNPFLRCPIPPVNATTDSLRQYYRGGLVPQDRILTPSPLSQSASVSQTNNSFVTQSITNTSTSTGTTTTVGTVATTTITTPLLLAQQSYLATIATSRAYIPLLLTTSNAARIELYGTAGSQGADFNRLATTAPGLGTEQGILLDVFMDTSPFIWLVTPSVPSANADSPQKQLTYITVTNLATTAANAIQVVLRYLILEP